MPFDGAGGPDCAIAVDAKVIKSNKLLIILKIFIVVVNFLFDSKKSTVLYINFETIKIIHCIIYLTKNLILSIDTEKYTIFLNVIFFSHLCKTITQ